MPRYHHFQNVQQESASLHDQLARVQRNLSDAEASVTRWTALRDGLKVEIETLQKHVQEVDEELAHLP